ncbi:MAG: polysaccharide biosynthesis C-terminal domain-containing protein [Planctomycetaceae bacterium]|nr:polysaccharide biosynthesis C-terminal domain-containing protein [Planctomycetaceae bacterium]
MEVVDRNGKGLIRDTAAGFVAMLVCTLVGVLLQMILAWQLGPDDRGAFGITLAMSMIIAVICCLGADRAFQVEMISGRLTAGEAVMGLLITIAAGATAASVVACMVSGVVSTEFRNLHADEIRLALLAAPVLAAGTSWRLLLAGRGHFRAFAVFSVAEICLQLGLTALLIPLMKLTAEAAILANVAGAGCIAAGALAFFSRRQRAAWRLLSITSLKRVMRYAVAYLPARLGAVTNAQLILLLLAVVAPQREVGIFVVATIIPGRIISAIDALNQSLQPRMGRNRNEDARLTATCCRSLALPLTTAFLCLLAAGPIVVPILFSEQFSDTAPLLWFLAPGLLLRGISKPLLPYFIGSGQAGVVSLSVTLECIVPATCLIPLYSAFGLSGAGIAVSLGCLCGALILVTVFHRQSQMSVRETWLLTTPDLRAAKQGLLRWLGVAPAARYFHVDEGSAEPSPPPDSRILLFAPHSVTKLSAADNLTAEIERTQAFCTIGEESGLFRVPRILEHDGARRIRFERLKNTTTLWQHLQQHATDDHIIKLAGGALAAIHQRYHVPPQRQQNLPSKWLPAPSVRDIPVGIHGDYNLFNLLVDPARPASLIITDCATSDMCGGMASVGPWTFDVAWFITGLCQARYLGWMPIPRVLERCETFLQAYLGNPSESAARRQELANHLDVIADRFDEIPTPPLLHRMLQLRSHQISVRQLRRVSKTLRRHACPIRRAA